MTSPRGPLARAIAASSCPVLLLQGDVRAVLRRLPGASVRCVVTSPPYWAMRDYDQPGQIGLEPTPEEWVRTLVRVFRHVRRVLTKDGTLWLNLGDRSAYSGRGELGERSTLEGSRRQLTKYNPKDLLGLPWMLALALRADGWILRQDIIWHKQNAMPESVKDRPTRAHEYVFLFAQRRHYYYDADALSEPLAPESRRRVQQLRDTGPGGHRALRGRYGSRNIERKHGDAVGRTGSHLGRSIPWEVDVDGRRNMRTVWRIPVQPYAGLHFATFPHELARRCLVAGSAPGDTVLDPFGGRGTVARAALELGRRAWHVDLGYHDLARAYITQGAPLLHPLVGDLCCSSSSKPCRGSRTVGATYGTSGSTALPHLGT